MHATLQAVERGSHRRKIGLMVGYSFYVLLVVGLTALLTAAFRRLRREDDRIDPLEEDAAFDRRMAEIEKEYGAERGQERRRDVRADGK